MPKPPAFKKVAKENNDETLVNTTDGPKNSCCCSKIKKMKNSTLTKTMVDHILKNVLIIKAAQGKSTENNIGSGPVSQELNKILGVCPINRREDLDLLVDFLKEEEHFACAAQQFSCVGDDSLYEFVKRILQKIMTNTLAINFNLQGRGGKESVCELRIFKLIRESTKKSLFSTSTDKEVEVAKTSKGARIKKWKAIIFSVIINIVILC